MDDRSRLLEAIDVALNELRRPDIATWLTPDGESAESLVRSLEATLVRNREAIVKHRSIDLKGLGGLVRWVADWVPDPDDRLISALYRVERALPS